MKGYTLTELMISMLVLITLAAVSAPPAYRLIQQQKVSSAANQVIALMYLARSEALSRGPVMLCDALRDCGGFTTTTHLTLHTVTANGHQKSPFASLQLPEGVTLRWRRFRGVSLVFQRDGRTHYQNGHFFICNKHAARKLIMSWSSRTRIEKAEPDDAC